MDCSLPGSSVHEISQARVVNGHEFEQALGDGEGQGSLGAAIHKVAKSWTWLSRAGEPGRRATLEIPSPRAASAALVLPQLLSAACWEGGCFCFCHRERSAVMLSMYGAHGWALSWASAPARRRTVCRTMWPGSPGPWRGQVCCCPGAVYTRSSAARGPSTLAPV